MVHSPLYLLQLYAVVGVMASFGLENECNTANQLDLLVELLYHCRAPMEPVILHIVH